MKQEFEILNQKFDSIQKISEKSLADKEKEIRDQNDQIIELKIQCNELSNQL